MLNVRKHVDTVYNELSAHFSTFIIFCINTSIIDTTSYYHLLNMSIIWPTRIRP